VTPGTPETTMTPAGGEPRRVDPTALRICGPFSVVLGAAASLLLVGAAVCLLPYWRILVQAERAVATLLAAVGVPTACGTSLALILLGVGQLRQRRWARPLAIWWSCAALLQLALLRLLVHVLFPSSTAHTDDLILLIVLGWYPMLLLALLALRRLLPRWIASPPTLAGVWSIVFGSLQVSGLLFLAWRGAHVADTMLPGMANDLRPSVAFFWWVLFVLSSLLLALGIAQQAQLRRARAWTMAWAAITLLSLFALVAVEFGYVIPAVAFRERQWAFHSAGGELAVVVPLLSALLLAPYPATLLVVAARGRTGRAVIER
jgi:hypothetical protein